MLKHYLKYKIQTKEFKDNLKYVLSELQGQKILICGNVDGFKYLNKVFHLDRHLDIVAFANMKNKNVKISGIKTVKHNKILNEEFDCILNTEEDNPEILINTLCEETNISDSKVYFLFKEDTRDTARNMDFLIHYNFQKHLEKLNQKLKGRRILLYGAGLFLNLICKHYDLSGLNIIGVADRFRSQFGTEDKICGYTLYSPADIIKLKPEYILLSTKRTVQLAKELYYNYVKDSDIKLLPLVKRGIIRTAIEG